MSRTLEHSDHNDTGKNHDSFPYHIKPTSNGLSKTRHSIFHYFAKFSEQAMV